MLRAENAHLKRLIAEQQTEGEGRGGGAAGGGAKCFAELAHLRRERDELQRQLATLRADYEDLQREYANLQRDRRMEVEALHSKTRTVEAQIEFLGQQHQQELDEKESRIQELEMKLVDLEQEVELAQSPLAAPYSQARSLDMDEMKDRVADLEKRLQVAKADNQRRAEETDRLREELQDIKARGTDEGTVASIKAERDYLRAQVEECEAKAKNYQLKAEGLEDQVERLCDETHKKMELVNRLEAEISDLRLQLEMAKTGDSRRGGGLAGGSGDTLGDETADVAELQRLLKEKEKSVWDLSDRLLQISTEKDQLEQAPTTASSQPLTPSSSSSKKKVSKTALTEDNIQLQQQVNQLQTQLAQIKKKDAEIAALEVSKEYQVQALSVARNVILPVTHRKPSGTKGKSASSCDSTEASSSSSTEEEEGDLQVALALKTAALRALSVKNAHLNDVLQRLRIATSAQQAEKELEDLSRKLEETRKELRESQEDVRTLKTDKSKLQARISRLETELDLAQRTLTSTREALQEAQTRNVSTADRYKAQSEKYSTMLSDAMREVDRLQEEVAKERTARLDASNRYREQIRALRASKARRLDVEDEDPLKPVYFPPHARAPRHRNLSLQEETLPKETEDSSGSSARSRAGRISEEGDTMMNASAKQEDRQPLPSLEKTHAEDEEKNTEDGENEKKKKLSGIGEGGGEREDDDQSSSHAGHLSKPSDGSEDGKSCALLVPSKIEEKDWVEISEGSKFSGSMVWNSPPSELYVDRNTTYILPSYDIQEGVIVKTSDGCTLYSSPAYYYSSSEGVSYSSWGGPIRYYPYDAIESYPIVQTGEICRGGGGEDGFSLGVTGGVHQHRRPVKEGQGVVGCEVCEYYSPSCMNENEEPKKKHHVKEGGEEEEDEKTAKYYSILGEDGIVRCVKSEERRKKQPPMKSLEPTVEEKHRAAEVLRKYVEEEELKRERRAARRKREEVDEDSLSSQKTETHQARPENTSSSSFFLSEGGRYQEEEERGSMRRQEGRISTTRRSHSRAQNHRDGGLLYPDKPPHAEEEESSVVCPHSPGGPVNAVQTLFSSNANTPPLLRKGSSHSNSRSSSSNNINSGTIEKWNSAPCGGGGVGPGSGNRSSPSSRYDNEQSSAVGCSPVSKNASESGPEIRREGEAREGSSSSLHTPGASGKQQSMPHPACGVITSAGANLQSGHVASTTPKSQGNLLSSSHNSSHSGPVAGTAANLSLKGGEESTGGKKTRTASPGEAIRDEEKCLGVREGVTAGEGRTGTRLRALTPPPSSLSEVVREDTQRDRGRETSPGTARGRQPQRQNSSPRETPSKKGDSNEYIDIRHVLGRLESVNKKGRTFFGEKGIEGENSEKGVGAGEDGGGATCVSEDVDLS
ncbi:hypothetical protein CSUI_003517 [Cystoisospora suis]|uniref:Uncharacterized protein n=1 Tax=Cystoisospora suis TaxID=483139 RepID=A0A2C6L569_9APIC|nr:hypothetical protein CSUI_003517 [Cystoisospora suis]